jgi:diaminopropionate ammonia-lyase
MDYLIMWKRALTRSWPVSLVVNQPITSEILRDLADYFAICPDFVAAMGMRVYDVPRRGDPAILSGESGVVALGFRMYCMQPIGARELRDELGLNSHVLLINSEGNTSPDEFRYVVQEGGLRVPEEYRMYLPRYLAFEGSSKTVWN